MNIRVRKIEKDNNFPEVKTKSEVVDLPPVETYPGGPENVEATDEERYGLEDAQVVLEENGFRDDSRSLEKNEQKKPYEEKSCQSGFLGNRKRIVEQRNNNNFGGAIYIGLGLVLLGRMLF